MIRSLLFAVFALIAHAGGAPAAELRFALHNEPDTLDPLMAADESAEAIRYLTEGVLIRVNRLTQRAEPELATSWKLSSDGARVRFELRRGVRFPSGAPFTSTDVVETFRALLDPALRSPIADAFKTDKGPVRVTADGDYAVTAEFPSPPAAFERLFDQVAIVSARSPKRPSPGLGPFLVSERVPGTSIVLARNPAYWKRDSAGRPLPRLDSIRLVIQENRDLELLRFRRGELHLIDKLTPDLYERVKAEDAAAAVDLGPTTDIEFLWFNLSGQAPIAQYKKEWFGSAAFRRAVSEAIQRDDLARVVYRGHASPAAGFVSPANRQWFHSGLKPDPYDPQGALKRLVAAGFRLRDGVLTDSAGRKVEFSLITNAGSRTRERMAAMIQQDLAKLGMQVNIVALEFTSLIERITRTLNYETCLLGLVNVDLDPNGLMNILLSSAGNHPWNPAQKSPQTPWEAEIDRLMLAQAATADQRARQKSFHQVQAILREQSPAVYLLHPNALSAVSRQVRGVQPSPFFPRTFWDAEHLSLAGTAPAK